MSTQSSAIRNTWNDRIFVIINNIFIILILFIVIYPLWYTIIASFSDSTKLATGEITFLPEGVNLLAYKQIARYQEVLTGYKIP